MQDVATDRRRQGLGVCVSVDATRFQMGATSLFSHRLPTFLSCLKFTIGAGVSPRHFDLRISLLSLLANALYPLRFLITILDHDLSPWNVLTLSRLQTRGQVLTRLDRSHIKRDY